MLQGQAGQGGPFPRLLPYLPHLPPLLGDPKHHARSQGKKPTFCFSPQSPHPLDHCRRLQPPSGAPGPGSARGRGQASAAPRASSCWPSPSAPAPAGLSWAGRQAESGAALKSYSAGGDPDPTHPQHVKARHKRPRLSQEPRQQLASFLPMLWEPSPHPGTQPSRTHGYLARARLPWKRGAAGCSPPAMGAPLCSSEEASSWVEQVLWCGEGGSRPCTPRAGPASTTLLCPS